ncbi:hypothetical protein BDN71DRAFT_666214 [Pleurotus eryngii]|uniref:Uncharacterized protein n=1 Tax=Pleurotus eryngii TaxID=5323 RepID=A0A9P6A063_PLEER|nr:hypothetical protein BDN71DRAFT_666214 [Pleurotus eryngii]
MTPAISLAVVLVFSATIVTATSALAPNEVERQSDSPSSPKASTMRQMERQLEAPFAPPPPLAVTTSSFNWWPYPLATSTTLVAQPIYTMNPGIPPPPPPLLSTPPSPIMVSIPQASTWPTDATAMSSSPFTSITTQSTSSSSTSMSWSTTSVACTTSDCPSSETSTLVHISAQPPVPSAFPTAKTFPKLKPTALSAKTARTKVVIICACAAVGLIAGSVLAWFCFGCCMARRRRMGGFFRIRRRDALQAGPAYAWDGASVDITTADQEKRGNLEANETHNLLRGPSFSWDIPTHAPFTEERREEGQAFLAPALPIKDRPSRTQTRKSIRSAMRRNTTKSVYSTLTGYEASPDPMSLLSDPEDDEELLTSRKTKPYESLRKGSKTIRRELLERVRQTSGSSSLPRMGTHSARRRVSRGHTRLDSDAIVHVADRERRAEKEMNVDVVDETQWVEGSGFRIVEEEFKSAWDAVGGWANKSRSGSGTNSPTQGNDRKGIFSNWMGSTRVEEDRYTPLPARSSPSKPSTRASRPTRNDTGQSQSQDRLGTRGERQVRGQPSIPRVDSSVLPRSPPQIMSPPLASQLFFTPQILQEPLGDPNHAPRRGQGMEIIIALPFII